jgi:hypothetical protein
MPQATTPSFVCEIPLVVDAHSKKALNSCLETSRKFYNRCVHEAKNRLNLMTQSKDYQKARSLDKKDPNRNSFRVPGKNTNFLNMTFITMLRNLETLGVEDIYILLLQRNLQRVHFERSRGFFLPRQKKFVINLKTNSKPSKVKTIQRD